MVRKVDIIYPGKVYGAIVGPAQIEKNIRRYLESTEIKDLEIRLVCADDEHSAPVRNNDIGHDTKGKLKSFVKNKLRVFLNLNPRISSALQELRIFMFVLGYIRKGVMPDILVFHHLSALYFFRLLSKTNVKTVIYQHTNGNPFAMYEMKYGISDRSKIFAIIKNRLLQALCQADKIILISQFGYDSFCSCYPELSEKSVLLRNGIPNIPLKDKEVKANNKINIITVGTISNRKGQDVIIRALGAIEKTKLSKYHLYIVGSGPQGEVFKDLVQRLNLSDNITFMGPMFQDDIIELFRNMDIMVLMSHSEGLPISLIEGLRSGLPIITTNVDGCPETVRDNGFILEKGDHIALANVLDSLNTAVLEEMSIKSRLLFEEEFDLERFVKGFLGVLREI